jgi:hypothetical protein
LTHDPKEHSEEIVSQTSKYGGASVMIRGTGMYIYIYICVSSMIHNVEGRINQYGYQ